MSFNTISDKIQLLIAPNDTYFTKPDSIIEVHVSATTDAAWINQVGYEWYWYRPVTTADGRQEIGRICTDFL